MKKCICLLCFMLCTALCLTACAKPEPAEPGLTYAELLATVKQETSTDLSQVLNINVQWSLHAGEIRAWGACEHEPDMENGSWSRAYASCSTDGSLIANIPLPEPEPLLETLEKTEEGQTCRSHYLQIHEAPDGILYILQMDEIVHLEEMSDPTIGTFEAYVSDAKIHYIRGMRADGTLTEPVLLQLPAEDVNAQVGLTAFFDPEGNFWVEIGWPSSHQPYNVSWVRVSLADGTVTKTIAFPENHSFLDDPVIFPDGSVLVKAKDFGPAWTGVYYYWIDDITADEPVYHEISFPAVYNEIDDSSLFVPSQNPSSENVYIRTRQGVTRWNVTKNVLEDAFRWEDYSVNQEHIQAAFALADGSYLLVMQEEAYGEYKFIRITVQNELLFDGREVITVAVPGQAAENVQQAANDYNFTSPEKLIRVLDYSDAAAAAKGFASGSEMLNNDIISGNVPDIVLTSAENITSHIRKGFFTDLYPFIDTDAELSRADLVAGTLAATEQDGTLPTALLSYNLLTAVGDPDVVGGAPGWTWEEFYSVLAANPQAKTPYYLYDRYYVLLYQLMLGGSDYLDYSTGTAHLDSSEFIRVLESSAAYPAENGDYTADPKPVFAARQSLLNIQFVGDFRSVIAQNYAFDGPVVYKGFPSDAGGGSAFTSVLRGGITSYCTDPDAAWQFLRTLLLPEFQDNIQHSLPVRRDSLQKLAQAAAEPGQMAGLPPYLAGVPLTESQQEYWKRGVTEEEAAALLALIESTDVLYQYDSTIASILWEEADYFYNGVRTAEEAAALIQSRVQTYLAEQG